MCSLLRTVFTQPPARLCVASAALEAAGSQVGVSLRGALNIDPDLNARELAEHSGNTSVMLCKAIRDLKSGNKEPELHASHEKRAAGKTAARGSGTARVQPVLQVRPHTPSGSTMDAKLGGVGAGAGHGCWSSVGSAAL